MKYVPNKHLDISTVKSGAELFIVSVKLTATWFNATNPKTTVRNLKKDITCDLNIHKF